MHPELELGDEETMNKISELDDSPLTQRDRPLDDPIHGTASELLICSVSILWAIVPAQEVRGLIFLLQNVSCSDVYLVFCCPIPKVPCSVTHLWRPGASLFFQILYNSCRV